jgi:hypothetical protein
MPIGSYDGDDVRVNPAPSLSSIYKTVSLLNGSSDAMNVNGSVTPVNFSFAPASGETWYVRSISLYIEDAVGNSTGFGSISSLTNGLILQVQSDGVSNDVVTLKDNIDVLSYFSDQIVSEIKAGFFGSVAILFGSNIYRHPQQMKLVGNSSDYIRLRVRDNLTSVDQLRAKVHLWKAGS